MKKKLLALLVALMLVTLTACGGNTETIAPQVETPVEQETIAEEAAEPAVEEPEVIEELIEESEVIEEPEVEQLTPQERYLESLDLIEDAVLDYLDSVGFEYTSSWSNDESGFRELWGGTNVIDERGDEITGASLMIFLCTDEEPFNGMLEFVKEREYDELESDIPGVKVFAMSDSFEFESVLILFDDELPFYITFTLFDPSLTYLEEHVYGVYDLIMGILNQS